MGTSKRTTAMRRWTARMLVFMVFHACLVATANVVAAQDNEMPDKVVLAVGGRLSTKTTLSGEILEYNGDILRIRTNLGQEPKEYSAADVVEVVTQQAVMHTKGLEQFRQGDYSESAKSLRAAIDSEPRTWVRRDILAALVRCHLMAGDYRNAANRFAILLRSDPKTRSFPLIPLIWSRTTPDPAFRTEAQNWLLDEEEPAGVRLMAASALLDDPQHRTSATIVLKDLAANKDRRVGALAGCQLWRLRLANPAEINLTELKSWSQRLESLPEELRTGPHYLLGRAYASRREFELAALHLLWQPLVQPDDHFLAAQAMLDAADALAKIGQLNGAFRLYEEIVDRFASTPAAQEAAGQIKELSKP